MKSRTQKVILNSGRELVRYILENDKGMEVEVISIGATLTKITAPDYEGKYENVTLKPNDIYKQHTTFSFGIQ